MLRSAGVLLVISALLTPAAQAYLTVAGNGTAPATANGTTFLTAVNKAVFFRPTGEYYFGLAAGGVAGTTGDYALSVGKYRTADTAPTLTKLGTDAAFTTLNIDQLAIVPNSNDATSPTIVAAPGAANVTNDIYAISKTALTAVSPSAAQLATLAGLGDTTPALTGGIRALASSRSSATGANLVFAAVKVATAGAGAPFGAGTNGAGAGALTDGINAAYITQTAGTPVFSYVGANGLNTARAVDCTATGSFLIPGGATALTMIGANPAFCFDEQLNRLYVGIQATATASGGAGQTSGICAVGIYPVSLVGTTITVGAQLVPAGSATDMANVFSATDKIVGISQNNTASSASILKLRTMHTSTGMAYLIVNGNIGASATAGLALQVANQVFAVPLVNGTPTATNDVGTFANINSGSHSTKAAATGDMITSITAASQVGGSLNGAVAATAPISVSGSISDIYVDGDAVYVATTGTPSAINEPGLWKSQAVFNDLGQIDHWTDWQKVAPNDLGGTQAGGTASDGSNGSVNFAAVDSYTGHIWAINNTSLKAKVTQWTQPTATPISQELLPAAINSALGAACYSVLDLNSSTTGWGAATSARVALFGGEEKVCFAITGSRGINTATAAGTYTAINMSMTNATYDYTQSFTFITTSLPTGAGAVISLGFSGWDADTATGATTGFFLAGCAGTAGTAPALYVYTPTATAAAAGFNPNTMGTTDYLFTSLGLTLPAGTAGVGTWQKVANVSGMPVKIQALGGGLHVLTRTATLDRIYSCAKQANIANLNTSFVVTASSGNIPTAGSAASSLGAVKQIYDFVVSVSATPATATPATGVEQLVMLTNDGIYTTSSLVGMQAPTSQLNAGWVLIDDTATDITTHGLFANYISMPEYNREPQTAWVASYAVNPAVANVFNKNILYQLCRQSFTVAPGGTLANALAYAADPTPTATFDGATSFNQTTAPTIYKNFPVLYRLFYNDGARRFFIQKNPNDDTKYQVLVLPYNLYDYNITADGKAPQADAVIAQAGSFYWMSPIGDTGRLMMGTSNGVISLQ